VDAGGGAWMSVTGTGGSSSVAIAQHDDYEYYMLYSAMICYDYYYIGGLAMDALIAVGTLTPSIA